MSRTVRKRAFCIFENKDLDNLAADQRLCFHFIDSTTPILPISSLWSFCGCTERFVLDLVENPEDRFSHDAAHIHTSSVL